MKKALLLFTLSLIIITIKAENPESHTWKAKWINSSHVQNKSNSWTIYHNKANIRENFSKATINIAVDSKYWLWINGELVIFEGGLKRGPNPIDTYYDELDVTQFVKRGENTIAVLVWYFGKDGFSHHSSGKTGLLFELFTDEKLQLISDRKWYVIPHPAYRHSYEGTQPNYRLPESNIVFDARIDTENFTRKDYRPGRNNTVYEMGPAGMQPWNNLVKRPIPQWKDSGLRPYASAPAMPFIASGDTIVCILPYNSQITPYFKIRAAEGLKIEMLTDNYKGGSEYNLRGKYITRDGIQEYESLGWINGHEMYYVIPEGVEVLDLKYRETGYNTEFAGSFESPDTLLNTLWEKAQRTLYINMRDSYMDCPDRERAQWWGDLVNQMSESFYSLCPESHKLARKGIYELMAWQKDDGTLYSPIPAGNWNSELPMQMLNSIGLYGFWTYFLYTGDTTTIRDVMPGVKKYLELWQIKESGLVENRPGDWTWGDWGNNKDMPVLYNTWYFLACRGYALMADAIGLDEEREWAEERILSIRENFNETFWTEEEYRSPEYTGETDDRANALAVLAGFADPEYYPVLVEVFQNNQHASPYMEKYVLEALFAMGFDELALERMKNRFLPMIESELTTLWEGWGIGEEGYGGGTYNHGWSGGGLTMLSKYVGGVTPASPGFKAVEVRPILGGLTKAKAVVSTVRGEIAVETDTEIVNTFSQYINSPEDMDLRIFFPENPKRIVSVSINDVLIDKEALDRVRFHNSIDLDGGKYTIIVKY
jgi:alpha-L-rhamnosidase